MQFEVLGPKVGHLTVVEGEELAVRQREQAPEEASVSSVAWRLVVA